MYNDPATGRRVYNTWMKEQQRAHNCVECGKCEDLCPQGIAVAESLKEADALLKRT